MSGSGFGWREKSRGECVRNHLRDPSYRCDCRVSRLVGTSQRAPRTEPGRLGNGSLARLNDRRRGLVLPHPQAPDGQARPATQADDRLLFRPCMLAARHHDDLPWRMSRIRAVTALSGDRADDSSKKIPRGIDLASARQCLARSVRHLSTRYHWTAVITSLRVAADGAAPFAPQAPSPRHVLLAPSTNGAVRGQDPPGGAEVEYTV